MRDEIGIEELSSILWEMKGYQLTKEYWKSEIIANFGELETYDESEVLSDLNIYSF